MLGLILKGFEVAFDAALKAGVFCVVEATVSGVEADDVPALVDELSAESVEVHGMSCEQENNTITVPEWQYGPKKEGPHQALNAFSLSPLAPSQRSSPALS